MFGVALRHVRLLSGFALGASQDVCKAGSGCNFPALEGFPVKVPMYCTQGAKDHYIGEGTMDFTNYRWKDCWKFLTSGTITDMALLYWHSNMETTVQMHDARALEAAEGLSKRDFFHKHGFVLLDHRSEMLAEDWLASEYSPLKAQDSGRGTAKPDFTEGETPVKQKYNAEIQELLKTVLPSAMEFQAPVRGIQRGPDSAYEKLYGAVVHTDFPVEYDLFRETNGWLGCDDHIRHFEATDAASYFVMNFWRPIFPMKGPVMSTPLAMLHPMTLDYKDFVRVDLMGQFPDGQTYLHVRYRPEHKWFYYPNMTTDEVLIWKQAHFVKGEQKSRMPVPHVSFDLPDAPKEAEPRSSFEHRVAVFCRTSDGQ
eukprot:TRINITY_DN45959_c0_g1_i1.p1 TRINITY_DN45959_c0_g1~~TRINITY_DN45959_c0_g1_i1.p1  ORF type:complete len:368 (+),score=42.89 TRINITY_DN45959_c0_g1_i1:94-1197(+)